MANFTTEQFNALMQAVVSCNVRTGSFSTCTSRYNGERNSSKVEEFISAVSTFKAVEKINDADAINAMPMLLEGAAAEWWSGVKANAATFDDVTRLLRESFSPARPAWRIYADICDIRQQKEESTDAFICKKRALFAQLTVPPSEAVQIDILFSKLHASIRERVNRSKVETFDELLAEARETEQVLKERSKPANTFENISGAVRCGLCHKNGHTREKCFKEQRAAEEAQDAAIAAVGKPKLACYGCNAPGVIRANCQNCAKKPAKDGVSTPVVNFNALTSSAIGRDVPAVKITLFGIPGQAIFDTGARTSVASQNLKRVLDCNKCQYETVTCDVTLADGSKSMQSCLSTICKIIIGGRCLNIKFLILPNASDNRTLIGADFMEQVGIVLNLGQKYWFFEGNPTQQFDFANRMELNLIETIKAYGYEGKSASKDKSKRELTNADVTTQKHHAVPPNYVSDFENFGPDITSDYSPHSVQSIFKDALPVDVLTPERNQSDHLFYGVQPKRSADEYNDVIFTKLLAVDFEIIRPKDSISVDPDKTCAISERRERFIEDYARIAKPLTDLTKKNALWKRATMEQTASVLLKKKLITSPILKPAQDGKPYILKTDANAYASGAVLLQGESEEEHRIKQQTQDRNKTYVDLQRRPQREFKVGSLVLVTTHVLSQASRGITAKFIPKRDGPYVITNKIGSSMFEVASPDELNVSLGVYHASHLTLFRGSGESPHPAPVHPIRKRGRPKKTQSQ